MGILDKYGYKDKIKLGYEEITDSLEGEFLGAEAVEENKKLNIKLKHPGAFSKWCSENGYITKDGHITCTCICKALDTDDIQLHKQATFLLNMNKKFKNKCKCFRKKKRK